MLLFSFLEAYRTFLFFEDPNNLQFCLKGLSWTLWQSPSTAAGSAESVLYVYHFPDAAVTHYHKLRGLKGNKLLLFYSSGGLKSEKGFTWLNSRCEQSSSQYGGSGAQAHPSSSSASGGTCFPWLVAPSLVPKVNSLASSNLSLTLIFLPPSFTCKGSRLHGAHLNNPGHSLHLMIVN